MSLTFSSAMKVCLGNQIRPTMSFTLQHSKIDKHCNHFKSITVGLPTIMEISWVSLLIEISRFLQRPQSEVAGTILFTDVYNQNKNDRQEVKTQGVRQNFRESRFGGFH